MPIPVERLKEATKTLDQRILAFLARNPDQAYNLVEIYRGVEGFEPESLAVAWMAMSREQRGQQLDPYMDALETLVRAGVVVAAQVQGARYFALKPTSPEETT